MIPAPIDPGVPLPPAPGAGVLIPARSERQAMDWSLALASQQIACVIRPPAGERGWSLEVDPPDALPALRTLRAYHLENRRSPSLLTPGVGPFLFHGGVLAWCLLLIAFHLAAEAPGSRLHDMGRFVTAAVAHGDWWRPLTATFLHSGLDHLAANLTSGLLLLGLAMGRYRAGPALLGTLLAGTLGNLLAWWWRGHDYIGLGASGVVMGALGMLTVSLLTDLHARHIPRGTVTRGLLGGSLLFILLGTSPSSDVLAHAGGFLCGGGIAAAFTFAPPLTTERRSDLAAAALYLILIAATWFAALRG
ncbi:MAG: rhomboid family intramembrane serine protease [Verrucomicrobiae bacterium]|nr:rhomboid family intramembrane serine protease [Verrucomicrobiae bacterium]